MTWHSLYRDSHVQRRLTLEERFPYLSSLLNHPSSLVGLAEQRAANWRRTRAIELTRPELVVSYPYHIVLDPASACNLRCPLCVQATDPDGRKRTIAKHKMLNRVLEQIAPLGSLQLG